MIKEVVFDFDGTIGLTFEASIKVLNEVAVEMGYRKINDEDIRVFRNEGWKAALKRIDFPMWKIPKTALLVQKKLNEDIEKTNMPKGLKEVLIELDKKGLVLGILTSNTKENVEKFCKKHDLDMFRYIYAEKSIFGKEKKIKKLLKDRKLKAEEILYVGDEVRDWEACQRVGVRMVGVSWGFNDVALFEKGGLKEIINKPEDLKSFV